MKNLSESGVIAGCLGFLISQEKKKTVLAVRQLCCLIVSFSCVTFFTPVRE